MAGNLGTLTLDLIAKIGSFTDPLSKAGREVKKFSEETRKRNEEVAKSFESLSTSMKVVAATAVVFLAEKAIQLGRAFFDMSKDTASAVEEIANMAEAVGITTQAMDRLINVGQLQNIQANEITSAMQHLSKAFEAAKDPTSDQAKIFETLSEAAGTNILAMKDMSKILLAVSDGFSKFEAGTSRTTAATELFGKAGQRLLTVFSKSQEDMAGLTEEADKFGGVISDLEVDKLKKLDNAFDHLGLAAHSFKVALVESSDALPGFVENLALAIKGAGDFIAFQDRFVAHMKGGGVEFGHGPLDKNVEYFERVEDFLDNLKSKLPVLDGNSDGKPPFPTISPDELKAQEKFVESIKKQADALQIQVATFGMSSREVEIYKLKIAGATDAQIALIDGLLGQKEALDKDAKAQQDATSIFVDNEKASEAFTKSIDRQIESLQLQAATFGMSSEDAELYRLRIAGATEEQLLLVGALLETVRAQKSAKDASQELADFYKAGAAVTDSNRTAVEEYGKEVEKLTDFLYAEAISQETFNKAKQAALDNVFTKPPEFDSGGNLDPIGKINEEQEALEEWYAKQLELLAQFREAKLGTEEEWDAKEQELKDKHAEELNKIDTARTKLALNSASDLFGSLADIAKNYQGESSKSYKALFAISKAFAIADATISLFQAIAKAGASGPFPANLGAMATVAASMAGLVSSITSVGLAHEGMDFIPKSGSWLLEKGERVTTEKTSKRLDRTLDRIQKDQRTGSGNEMNVTVNEAPGTSAQVIRRNDGGLDVNIAMVEERLLERMSRGTGLAGPLDQRYGRKY